MEKNQNLISSDSALCAVILNNLLHNAISNDLKGIGVKL